MLLHVVLSQDCVCLCHVADDDGYVLEPQVVAARVGRKRASRAHHELQQLDGSRPQPEVNHADARADYASQLVELRATRSVSLTFSNVSTRE